MSVVTSSMGNAKAKAVSKKYKTHNYNRRNIPSVNYADDISSEDDIKEGLKEGLKERHLIISPPDTLANDSDLKLLNLTPKSLDPSGKYLIIVKATELEYPYVRKIGPDFYKWAIAPQGYYYYWNDKYDWYELALIPV